MALQRQGVLLEEQGKRIERMDKTLIGNGDQGSVVARLLLAEEKQRLAEEERHALSERLAAMQECIETIEERQTEDHNEIENIGKEQKSMSKVQDKIAADVSEVVDTLSTWKNRGLGFIAGVSALTSGALALIGRLIESILG